MKKGTIMMQKIVSFLWIDLAKCGRDYSPLHFLMCAFSFFMAQS